MNVISIEQAQQIQRGDSEFSTELDIDVGIRCAAAFVVSSNDAVLQSRENLTRVEKHFADAMLELVFLIKAREAGAQYRRTSNNEFLFT